MNIDDLIMKIYAEIHKVEDKMYIPNVDDNSFQLGTIQGLEKAITVIEESFWRSK